MKLKQLELHRNETWEKNPGTMSGSLKFESPKGEVMLVLPETHCRQIIEIVADGLVSSSREIATELTAEILTSFPAIAGPKDAA